MSNAHVSVDFSSLPQELIDRDQWLLWDKSAERKQPFTLSASNSLQPASWTDPDDWLDYDTARNAVEAQPSVGLGFVLANDVDEHARGLYGGLDLDGCIEPDGGPVDWLPSLEPFFERDAYIERSDSGEGLHVPLVGFEPPSWWSDIHKSDAEHEGVEAYGKKFFAFTGDTLRGSGQTIAESGDWVEHWLAEAYEALTGEDPQAQQSLAQRSRDRSGERSKSWSEDDEFLTEDDIRDALSHIDPGVEYPTWRDIGFGLVNFFGDRHTARRLFENWSRRSSKWDSDAERYAERIINDADPDGDVTIATVIEHARQGGWEMPTPDSVVGSLESRSAIDESALVDDDDDPLDKQTWDIWSERFADDDYDADDYIPVLALKYIARREGFYNFDALPEDIDTLPPKAHNKALYWVNNQWPEQAGLDVDDDEAVTAQPYMDVVEGPFRTWEDVRYTYEKASKDDGRYAAVQLLREKYDFLTPEDLDELHVYDPDLGVYDQSGRYDLTRELDRNLGKHYSQHEKTEIVGRLKEERYERDDLDAGHKDGNYVCVENGVLDLDERELLDHDPDWLFTSQLPVTFNPDADPDRILQFLREITKRDEDWQTMVEMLGNVLLDGYEYESFLVLFGEGANGKSTWYEVCREFIGTDNVSSMTLQQITDTRFAASNLVGQWANIGEDLPEKKIQDLGTLKDLTGGGQTHVEPKGKQGFDFTNRAKMMFAANRPPVLGERTTAVSRRLLPVRLPYRFTTDPCDGHKDAQKEGLLDELTTEEQLSGLLNLALDGLDRLRETGDFSLPEDHEERLEYYEQYSDHIKAFAVNCLDNEGGEMVKKSTIYDAYTDYCEAHGYEASSTSVFWTQLRKTTLDISEIRPQSEDRQRCIDNIAFTDEGLDYVTDYQSQESSADEIAALADGDEGVTVEARVVDTETDVPDAIAMKATVQDQTAEMRVTIWADSGLPDLAEGECYRLKNARVQEYDGQPEIQLGDRSGIQSISDGVGLSPAADAGDNAQLEDLDGRDDDSDEPGDLASLKPRVVRVVQKKDREFPSGVPHDVIVGALARDGASPDAVDDAIDICLEDGSLYKPSEGRYRTT